MIFKAGEPVWAKKRKAKVLYVTLAQEGTRVGVQLLGPFFHFVSEEVPAYQITKR